MTRAAPEYALHCAVADYLRAVLSPEVLWTTIGHGGGGAVRGAKLKRAGLRPGIADIFISWREAACGQWQTWVIWIELKAAKGRMSPDQIVFADDCKRAGNVYRVAKDIAGVEKILDEWGVPRRGKIAA